MKRIALIFLVLLLVGVGLAVVSVDDVPEVVLTPEQREKWINDRAEAEALCDPLEPLGTDGGIVCYDPEAP